MLLFKGIGLLLPQTSLCCRRDFTPFDDKDYTRVFLSKEAALHWWRYHRLLGPPSKAVHVQALIERSKKHAKQSVLAHDYTGAMQALALAAGAQLDHSAVLILSRCGFPLEDADAESQLRMAKSPNIFILIQSDITVINLSNSCHGALATRYLLARGQ